MKKPIILTVDDDVDVLRAVERDLRRQYGERFRVMRAESGAAALELVQQLKLRNEALALFLVDQRMPRMSGVEFLEQALKEFPTVKRALLTAYADTEAAIQAINEVALDYYLLKPWDPPEEHLYPVVEGVDGVDRITDLIIIDEGRRLRVEMLKMTEDELPNLIGVEIYDRG